MIAAEPTVLSEASFVMEETETATVEIAIAFVAALFADLLSVEHPVEIPHLSPASHDWLFHGQFFLLMFPLLQVRELMILQEVLLR